MSEPLKLYANESSDVHKPKLTVTERKVRTENKKRSKPEQKERSAFRISKWMIASITRPCNAQEKGANAEQSAQADQAAQRRN